MSILGLIRPKPIENPASNIAARVSLPLTMSNIPRTMGFHPAIRRIRPGRVGRPVCDEARGISPALISRQQPFLIFFQRSTGPKKTSEKSDRNFLGPIVGARDSLCGRREGAIYARPARHASGFWLKMQKLRVFHRTSSPDGRAPKTSILKGFLAKTALCRLEIAIQGSFVAVRVG